MAEDAGIRAQEHAEDEDSARLVDAFHAGDREAFGALYSRYFDRVYGYLRVAFQDRHEAEDAAQQVFTQALEALPRYECGAEPFRAWLFTIARNHTLGELRKRAREEVVDPAELDALREMEAEPIEDKTALSVLDWIDDVDLFIFAERLPFAQRQVLVLRYIFDLTDRQIATVLGRTAVDVRSLQHRALRFLEKRLDAVGRGPNGRGEGQGKDTDTDTSAGTGADRSPWRRRPRQAPVLRERRFQISEKRPNDRDPRRW
jgi:RNA polymerase sigma-70 factor, ECF subfamily